MSSANSRRITVKLAKTVAEEVDVVCGDLTGLTLADVPVLEDALQTVERAIRSGMFALGKTETVALRLADMGPTARRFTFEADTQHASLLRVIGNILCTRLAVTPGPDIDLQIVGFSRAASSDAVPTLAAIPYLGDYRSLPFEIRTEALVPARDWVVRIHCTRALSDQSFREYTATCRLWDQLLASGAYQEVDDVEPPFVQDDLELYMLSPTTIEHLVLSLRQSADCFVGLCMALARISATAGPIRLVEIAALL